MRFKARRHQITIGGLDAAPFLNVFFILLIFFMFSSSFIFQPGISVNLPKAVTGEVVTMENIVITISKDNEVFLNDRRVGQDELYANFGIMAREKTPLLIKADRNSSLWKIIEVLDMCRQAGVSQISLATMQEVR